MVMGSLPEQVDLAVIGGGVGGYVAAIRAAQLGMSVALVEKEKLGGHCLNYACIPSKTLIHISDIFYDAQHSEKFGISGNLNIDAKKMLDWRMGVSKKLEDGVIFLLKSNQVDVFKGTATFLNNHSLQLTDGVTLEFKNAIIATGSEPTVLKGFEFGNGIIDYKQALMLDRIPGTMAIIGAGYVSVEIGTLYAKLGTKVTIIARSDVLSKFDKDAVALVKKRMQELGIRVIVNATPLNFLNGALKMLNGEIIDAEVCVVATGLTAFTKGLGLENTQVEVDEKGCIKVDEQLRTKDQDIFAIGDVSGEPMLAHRAMRQGVVAAEAASGMNSSFDNLVIPAVIFCDPEVAIAGSMEPADGVTITKFPLTALGRAIALDATNGFVKIAADASGLVKGVEIVGPDASSLISEACLAIEMGATLEDIADTIHPHPTYGESIQEAAESALGRGVHFFKPKQ